MEAGERPAAGWLERFDAWAADFYARHEVPGGAVAIVKDGETAYERPFGLRDREAGAAAEVDTLFGVASLTKSFTALTLLALQAKGVLSLSDPVTRHLPAFSYPGLPAERPVRLWHLASHTSGLPPVRGLDYAIHPSQAGDPAEAFNERDYASSPALDDHAALLAYLAEGERPALPGPGEVVSYSNDGYALLGAVIEAVTGEPYPDVVAREVLRPLGMDGAGFDTAAARATGKLTELYTRAPEGAVIHSPKWEEAPAYLATGFLKASAADLAGYLAHLLRPRPGRLAAPPEALADLFRPRGWAEHLTGYGLGWMVRERFHGLTLWRHGGSLKGVSAHQGGVPALGLGVAVLANLDEVPVKRLWYAAVNAYSGLPLESPPFEHGALPASPESLAGVYASGEPWGRLELVAEGGALRALSGEKATPIGVVEELPGGELVVVDDGGPWDSGRFVYADEAGGAHGEVGDEPIAVQYGMRWYDKVRTG